MIRTAAICLAALSLTPRLTGLAAVPPVQQTAPAEDWTTFAGSWSARGERRTIPTEGNGTASIVQLSGAVVLARGTGFSGFLGEAITFDDGRALSVGRAVWTDQRGDRVFSDLKGEAVASGRRVVGTITGGTGRYAGIVGDYEFVWQYVAQDGSEIQGRAGDLKGKFRKDPRR